MSITLNTTNSFYFDEQAEVPNEKKYDATIYKAIEIIKTIVREKINGNTLSDKLYFLEGRTGSGKSTFLVSELFKAFIRGNDLQKDSIVVVEPKVILTQSNALNIVRNNPDIYLEKDIGYLSSRLKIHPKNKKNITMMTTEIFKQKYLNSISTQKKIASIVIIDEVHILDIPMISLLNIIYNSINQDNISILPLFIFTSATIDIEMLVKYFSKHISLTPKQIYADYKMIGYVIGKRNYDVQQYFLNEQSVNKMSFEHLANYIYNVALKKAIESKSTIVFNGRTISCRDILVFLPITKYFTELAKHLKRNFNNEVMIYIDTQVTKKEFYDWRSKNRNKLRFIILSYSSGYSQLSEELLKYSVDPDPEANLNEIKIILSTPAIETGKTISTLYIVIDTGLQFSQFFKPLSFNPNKFTGLLHPISKNAAIQRNGRVGREAEGIAISYYTKKTFENMELKQLPENINLISVAGMYIDNFKIYHKNFTGDYVKDRLDLIKTNDYVIPNSIDTLIRTKQDLINIMFLTLNGEYTYFNDINLKVDNWSIYAKYLYYCQGYKLFDAIFIARLNRKFLTTYLTPTVFKFKHGLETIEKFQEQPEDLKKEILEAITEAKRITNIHKYFKQQSLFIEV